jgi:hypothetical protein
MQPTEDRLTLEELLADPLTRLLMRSDNVTVAETARAFAAAGMGLAEGRISPRLASPILCRNYRAHPYRQV